jgi:hypothetical protein
MATFLPTLKMKLGPVIGKRTWGGVSISRATPGGWHDHHQPEYSYWLRMGWAVES